MMKKSSFKRFFTFLKAFSASLIVVPGVVSLCEGINGPLSDYVVAHAEEEITSNRVYLEEVSKETNTSNLIRVNLVVEGVAGQTISVTYSTKSGTAVENIDYSGVNNTISFSFTQSEIQKHEIAIKILNTSSDREMMRVKDGDNKIYGRYFTLSINKATNDDGDPVDIDGEKKSCKCYLPYSNETIASVGITDSTSLSSREIAYLNAYQTTLYKSNKSFYDLANKNTWKSWEKGFYIGDVETRKKWATSFINTGLANAYGTFIAKEIDDNTKRTDSNMDVLFGNWDMTTDYSRSADCPGLSLYFAVNTDESGGYRLDGRAMEYIAQGIDPTSKEDKLVNVDKTPFIDKENSQNLYFRLPSSGWYGSKDELYSSRFYKIKPSSSGELNMCVAFYNDVNSSYNRFKQVIDPVMFMTLADVTAPEVVNQWAEYNEATGKVRIYVRFNEPVYSSLKKDLTNIRINGISQTYTADYVEGNYSDTLVYEMDNCPKRNIASMTYQLPDNDIGDMAYRLNVYSVITNNLVGNTDQNRPLTIIGGNIDLTSPSVGVDISSSASPKNVYNIMVTADKNGTGFTTGTAYYLWDNNASISNPGSVDSYSSGSVRNLSADDQGSFAVTLANRDAGSYYLHVLVTSKYGNTSYDTFGPYVLDGRAPEIIQTQPSTNTLSEKVFVLQTTNKTSPSTQVKNVTMYTKYTSENETKTDTFAIVNNGTKTSSSVIIDDTSVAGKTLYKYNTNISNTGDYFRGLMGEEQHFECEVYFTVEDYAGNKATSNSMRVTFDTRNTFKVTVTIPTSYEKVAGIGGIANDIYNTSGATSSEGINYALTDSDLIALITGGAKFSLLVNGEEIFAESGQYSITLSDAAAGYYSVLARISGTSGTTAVEMISGEYVIGGAEPTSLDSYKYYLTKGNKDSTPNKARAEGNIVLSNEVYQVEDVRYVYYDNNNKNITNHLYGATYNSSSRRYEGGSSYPTFSSVSEAKKYFTYMEKQDLYLEKITDSIAQYLNTGSGSVTYVKASGETKIAQSGQLWIRYKRSTWNDNNDTTNWVYYYYGEGSVDSGINHNDLTPLLQNAIDTVVNTILKSGKKIYLVDEGNINQSTGAPYLLSSQMHVDREEVATTKSGINYVSDLVYEGDNKLYQNTVTYENKEYPLATNMELIVDSSTHLYLHNGGDNWELLNATDGMTIRDVLSSTKATGVYTIREYSDEGIGEFSFFFDNSLPIVTAYKDGATSTMELDGTDTNLTCRVLVLDAMSADKIDPYTYVAIYSYPYRSLIDVLYSDSINGYTLTDGNYYVQIGDRSGNIITYTVLTSNTDIDLKIYENDSKTAVIVKVNNRSESEIYSYEVYLNEVLIDNVFAATKTYRDPGVYRVVVRDIYGNIQPVTLSHDSPTPEMTWYYINSSGSTSRYNPAAIDRMIVVPDESNSRLTNVYASTLVSVIISSAYETGGIGYELTGLNSNEYTYNETTGLLSIRVLKGWTLRVWYTNTPEADMLYVFQIDSNAPAFEGTYIGSSFVFDSDFSDLNLDDYEVGDYLSYEELTYSKSAASTLEIMSGDVISGSRVSFSITDPSGIKPNSVTVTRNGTTIDAGFNYDTGVLDLAGYGKFIITAIDTLGNTARFEFTNISSLTSQGFVDEEEISENTIDNYGHKDLVVDTLFEGSTTILIKRGSSSSTYIFEYDGSLINYGYYYVAEQTIENQTEKYVEYRTVGTVFDVDDNQYKVDTWYNVIRDVYFIISVMVKENGEACYKIECVSSEIVVETLTVINGDKIANRYKATLAKTISYVDLYVGSDLIENTKVNIIYIADDLTVGNTVDANIKTIEVAYNKTPTFTNYEVIYKNGGFVKDFVGKDDGFYRIIVTNIYHNTATYTISKIDTFNSLVTIHVQDGSEVTYTIYPENEPICSNNSIDLIIYSDSVMFNVNGIITSGYYESGATVLSLTSQGQYSVRVLGSNGIFQDFLFDIKSDDNFLYQDSWITGYNKDALLADEYYTNTRCDINLSDNMVFIDMVINDDLYVKLYDRITDNPQTDPDILRGAIGAYGDGDYAVGFRNKYGDLVIHTVHYSATPALTLSRKTVSNPDELVPYDLSLAMDKGFYSNYVLSFTTTSSTYIFKINDENYRLDTPKTLEFSNMSGNGYFSYRVYYKDEYGNDISFNAILNREDVLIDVSRMKTTTLNSELYTKDDVVVVFADSLIASVSLDDGTATPYTSGKAFYKDGKYKFVVEDIAGNQNIYTINHKSVNHYRLFKQSTDENIIFGGITNNSIVSFSASDGSSIKYVFRNGELQEGYSSANFSTTGHWELIIEDAIGNQSYEEFYIINNALASFDYTAPIDYEVSEVWIVNSDGSRGITTIKGKNIKLSTPGDYLVVVTSTKTASSFNFTITINNDAPKAALVGAENGGVTARDVSLTNLASGDVVKIYRNNQLISTTTIGTGSASPSITTSGEYRIVITNIQGVTVEYTFVRRPIASISASVFIMITCALAIVGMGVGLIYRTKLKADD